ncbi:MAG: MMPL family transporter [Brevinematia bacterium]
MESFFKFVLEKRTLVILLTLILFALGVFGIFRLYIDNDVLHWFSRDSEIAKLNYYVNERFRSNNPIIVMISFNGSVFTKERLEFVRAVSKIIKEQEGIVTVVSITEVEDIKSTEKGIVIEKLFPDEIPEGENLERIREIIMSRDAFKGSLVSRDGTTVNILALPVPDRDTSKIGEKVRSEVEKFISLGNMECKVFFGGAPMILNSISKLVVSDISKLVPIVSLVVSLTLFLSFRNLVGTFIPLITVLISCAIGMGVMGYLGYPLTTFGVGIPVVLIAVGNAYAIHVINEYYERMTLLDQPQQALLKSLVRVFIPVLMSGITTIASFISVGLGSEINTTKNFATISSVGISFATLFTLTFVPAILSTLNIRSSSYHKNTSKFLHTISKFIFKHRTSVSITFLTISLISVYLLTKVKVEVDYLGYFDEKTEPRKVTLAIADNFDGSFELKTYFKGNIQNPTLLKVMQIIEEEQRYFLDGITRPQSIVRIIAELNEGMVDVRSIPDSEMEIQNLWFFIEGTEDINRVVSEDKNEALINILLGKVTSSQRYELIRLTRNLIHKYSNVSLLPQKECLEEISSIISKSLYSRLSRTGIKALETPSGRVSGKEEITSYLNKIILEYLERKSKEFRNYEDKKRFIDDFVKYILLSTGISLKDISEGDIEYALSPSVWNTFPIPSDGEGIRVFDEADVTGIAKLFADMERQILQSQIISLGLIVFVVFVMNCFTFRSLLEGLISLIPIVFTLLVNFGIMGLANIKIDFITVTIASIGVGTGIDYTIHFISRYVYEIRSGSDYENAFYKTFSTTGKGILSNAFAVGLGFATLLFSSIVPLRNFGLMMSITMMVSSISALTLLPVVLIALRKRLKTV